MLKEFQEFALKGNVVDLAIGVIIGSAFGKIVDSLVKDIIMPMLGVFGGLDFSNYFIPLSHNVTAPNLADAQKQGAVLAWGSFATYCVNFLIVASVLFVVVRGITVVRRRMAHEPDKMPAGPTRSEALLEQIRDALTRPERPFQ